MLAEAKSTLPALKAIAHAKAGPDGVRRVLAKRFTIYPQPERSDEEWADWFSAYLDVLEDVSLASLEAGMRAYVAMPDSEFMPKPGKLRELAFLAPCRALTRVYRAIRAIQFAEQSPLGDVEEIKPRVDPAEVKAMVAEFEAKSSAGGFRKLELPSISGEIDESGITAEMRALIARRAEEARS